MMSADASTYRPGLEGVVAGKTTVGSVDPKGITLLYQGYDVRDLVQNASYEEVAYLLIYGKLPTQEQYTRFVDELKAQRYLSNSLLDVIEHFPQDGHLMHQLKAAVSLVSLYDRPAEWDNLPLAERNYRKATSLIAKVPTIVAALTRHKQGHPILPPQREYTHAENLYFMITGNKPEPAMARAMNAILILYAEHGFNASTFAARVTASTMSDMFSSIVSAICTLKGPLHGGANEEAMRMLLEVGDVDNAEPWIRHAVAEKRLIMGFGHRQYKNGDPRARILQELAIDVAQTVNDMRWINIAEVFIKTMRDEKALHPNVDFPIAYIFYMMGLPIESYTPLFAAGRIAGWCAHVIEQHANNRLIRPDAIYEGPVDLKYQPMQGREAVGV
jgi:citrate synthase